jgi:hypothetical protein
MKAGRDICSVVRLRDWGSPTKRQIAGRTYTREVPGRGPTEGVTGRQNEMGVASNAGSGWHRS